MTAKFRYYVLDGHEVTTVDTVEEWGQRFDGDRIVAQTQVTPEVRVSTVFLGIDHNFFVEGPPLIFETMVFGGPDDGEQRRYSTWAEAETGHMELVDQQERPA